MEIKRVQNADRMVLTNGQGQSMSISMMEFWEICSFGARLDTRDEVENLIRDCEEVSGLDADKILENEDLMNQIVEGVIAKRVGNENGDQIYEVAKEKVKEQLEQKITLTVREYADENEEKPVKSTEFTVGYSALENCTNELGYLSVEDFVQNYNNDEAKTVYDYMKAFGNVLSEKTVDCEVIKASLDAKLTSAKETVKREAKEQSSVQQEMVR